MVMMYMFQTQGILQLLAKLGGEANWKDQLLAQLGGAAASTAGRTSC